MGDVGERTWECWEPAAAGPAPGAPGPWRRTDGVPLHGVWVGPNRDGSTSVVVTNHGHVLIGWRVPLRRWRFTSELVRASNCALAQVPWVWLEGGRLVATDPSDVAVGLVLAGRKPAALADTADERLARSWEENARAAGLVVRRAASTFDCGPVPTTRWFVQVAVPGTVAEHFDLDALLSDYAACLPARQLTDVERALCAVGDEEIAEVVADPDLIMASTPGEYARTGLVLGYHPATTAGLIRNAPRFSWASYDGSAGIVNVLAPAADPAPLPGLPSSLAPEPEGVR